MIRRGNIELRAVGAETEIKKWKRCSKQVYVNSVIVHGVVRDRKLWKNPAGCHKEMSSVCWLTNSALAYEPKCGRRKGVAALWCLSQWVHGCAHGAQNKLGRSNSIFNLWNLVNTRSKEGKECRGCYFHNFYYESLTISPTITESLLISQLQH